MAAGRLPEPGTQFGPCADPCAHIDCGVTRADAAQDCPLCHKPIGYEVRFYMDEESRQRPDGHRMLVHARCLEDRVYARV